MALALAQSGDMTSRSHLHPGILALKTDRCFGGHGSLLRFKPLQIPQRSGQLAEITTSAGRMVLAPRSVLKAIWNLACQSIKCSRQNSSTNAMLIEQRLDEITLDEFGM